MRLKKSHSIVVFLLVLLKANSTSAQSSWPEKMAATVMNIWSDSLAMQPGRPVKWTYDQGVILEGMDGLWNRTANAKYYNYIQKSMDFYVQDDGSIRTYKQDDYNIDNIKNGRSLLLLYK